MPHDIIHVDMGVTPINIEALFRPGSYILCLISSRQLTEYGDTHCWYAEMQQWFESHGIRINPLPLFRYSLD